MLLVYQHIFQVEAVAKYYNNDAPGVGCRISVEWDSIKSIIPKNGATDAETEKKISSVMPWNGFKCNGVITNLNTLDGFKVNRNKIPFNVWV